MVSALLLPPLLPFILILIGLLLIWRQRARFGFATAGLGLVIGVFSIAPATVDGILLAGLEPKEPLQPDQARDAQAIVILGGGRMLSAPEYAGDTVNNFTLERLRYGAKLARELGLPVLVSGGPPGGATPEAHLMKAVLEKDFNVPVNWTEDASRDTQQNARNSAAILQAEGIRRIVLVTHAFHMRRAQLEFESQGFEVTAAPTVWMGRHRDAVLPALPSPSSSMAGWQAMHEWLGLLAYRLSR